MATPPKSTIIDLRKKPKILRLGGLEISIIQKEFNQKRAEYINKLLEEINKILVSYVNENSIDIVIKKEDLITGKKNLDITKFILDELNKKKIKF